MQNNPLVSVLLPCYNVEKYVEETIDSLLKQTYTNFEIIAINDCSTDSTSRLLHKLAQKDTRIIVYENEKNLRLIKTLNKGIDLCKGKYIARMDADDICMPERLMKEVEFLESNEDYDIVSTQFATFKTGSEKLSVHTNPTKNEELQAYLLFKSGICHPASMIRKTMFTDLNLRFEEQYLHVEDYALWSKAIYKTKLANIGGEPLLLYRLHQSQVSSLNEELQTENKKEVFKIHCEHLGLDNSKENLDVYASVAEAIPLYSSFEYIDKCEHLMLLLIEKNKEKAYSSQLFLEHMLSFHWIRLCANSRLGLKVLKKCFSSTLYKRKNYKTRDIIILYIKCLFKLQYRKSLVYKIVFR